MTRPDPARLAAHYTRFRVHDRLLLTGHSHQAWPDCGFAAQQQAWLDAADLVDDKWDRALAMADRVRAGFRRLLEDADGEYALGPATHDLVVRLLSALPLAERPRIVTTTGEYHSLRRQLDRLGEAGIEIVRVPVDPLDTLTARLAAATTPRTAAVCLSAVLFRDARIVPALAAAAAGARRHGAVLLLDAYHALNVVPLTITAHDLGDAFIVGGGYKYCQLGEGNCFLRVPPDCALRPVVTGWYAEFTALAAEPDGRVRYGPGPHRFAGSTYDPTSHYRAAAVFDFCVAEGLTPARLRAASQHQVARLIAAFDAADPDPAVLARDRAVALGDLAGFLALRARDATGLQAALRAQGLWCDARGDLLRLGPAPYLTDDQLDRAMALVLGSAH